MKKNVKPVTRNALLHPLSQDCIIGIESVDALIIQLDRKIIDKAKEEIKLIADAIIAFWFRGASSIPEEIIENENITEYIYGIKEIIIYEDITNIIGLRKYIQKSINFFDPNKICNII